MSESSLFIPIQIFFYEYDPTTEGNFRVVNIEVVNNFGERSNVPMLKTNRYIDDVAKASRSFMTPMGEYRFQPVVLPDSVMRGGFYGSGSMKTPKDVKSRINSAYNTIRTNIVTHHSLINNTILGEFGAALAERNYLLPEDPKKIFMMTIANENNDITGDQSAAFERLSLRDRNEPIVDVNTEFTSLPPETKAILVFVPVQKQTRSYFSGIIGGRRKKTNRRKRRKTGRRHRRSRRQRKY